MNEQIARKYSPIVVQGIADKYKDAITPIYFGDFMRVDLKPTIYYEVNDYIDYKTVVYCYFHRLDFKKLGSHPFDFEGCIKFIDGDGKVLWSATRYHYHLKFVKGDAKIIYIDAEGHSIRPVDAVDGWGQQVVYNPRKFDYVDMAGSNYRLFNEKIYPILDEFGVTEWRKWNDKHIKHKFGLFRTIGLIHKDPRKLYKYAKSCHIVKGE